MNYWLLAILVVVCYFLGNINFGRIISRAKHVDLTKKGSGNLGATNMYRNLGAKLGYLTLLLDALKGIIAALVGYFVFGGADGIYPDALIGLYSCGLAAVVGHIFPVIYKFKGGKGISTTLGVFLVAEPLVMLITFIFCFILVWFVKYVSLASLILVTVGVVVQNLTLPEPNLVITLLTFAIFALTWFAHRKNIERLIVGKENETNIKAKIRRDQKKLEKLENRQEIIEAKIEIKNEIKQEKLEQKTEKKEQKAILKKAKKRYKNGKKSVKNSEKVLKKREKYNKKYQKKEYKARPSKVKGKSRKKVKHNK